MVQEVFLKGNVPSSKNSKQFIPARTTKSGATIKPMFLNSKTVANYLRSYEHQFYTPKLIITETPVILGFHFVRDSKRRFDFGNSCQIIQDLMVKFGWIEDDNMDYLIPVPLLVNDKWYSWDKDNPGVLIRVLNKEFITKCFKDDLLYNQSAQFAII